MASALDPPPPELSVGGYPVAGLVRRARRIADMSQRQMARFAKVVPSTIGSRSRRDAQRRRSQWEVRVAQHHGTPPPPRVVDGY